MKLVFFSAAALAAPLMAQCSDQPPHFLREDVSPMGSSVRRPSYFHESSRPNTPALPRGTPPLAPPPLPRASSHRSGRSTFDSGATHLPYAREPAGSLSHYRDGQVNGFDHIKILECGDFLCTHCNRIFRNPHKHEESML
jgi:hypothetical protein